MRGNHKYDPDFCNKVIEFGKKGFSRTQMASELGVIRDTLSDWETKHEEFAIAIHQAMAHAQSWWEHAGMQGLFAEKFNATAFIFQMKNRFRDDYRDVQDHRFHGRVQHDHTGAREILESRINRLVAREREDGSDQTIN